MSLDGFSMSALARELADALTGGRIDKINQPNKQSIVLSVRQPGKNLLLYINTNASNPSAHLIENAPENPAEPPTFVMLLRKQLETGRIAAVRQEGRDRILHMDIDVIAGGGRIVTRTLTLEHDHQFGHKVHEGVDMNAAGTHSHKRSDRMLAMLALLQENGQMSLSTLATVLNNAKVPAAHIYGHTDSVSDEAFNQKLSEDRANAVSAELKKDGVSATLDATGYGETKPVAPNENPDGSDNPAGRALNRRVEIYIPAF